MSFSPVHLHFPTLHLPYRFQITKSVAHMQIGPRVASRFFTSTVSSSSTFSSYRHLDSPQLPSSFAVTTKSIRPEDCLEPTQYAQMRRPGFAQIKRALKSIRLFELGPFASVAFENYDTIWFQTHEMVHIEKGGYDQLVDEIGAYSDMLPQGNDLTCTFMIEISNAVKRKQMLSVLGHIENTLSISFSGHSVRGAPISEDRTTPEGKTSSVHFLRFSMTPEQATAFAAIQPGTPVSFSCSHPKYAHSTTIPDELVQELKKDLIVK